MNDKTFGEIESTMTQMINYCKSVNGDYNRRHITNAARNKARKIQGNMDKIFANEVYHIIGMGDLTTTQTLKFNKMVKDLSKYRPVIKCVASMQLEQMAVAPVAADAPMELPAIKESVYKSMLAGTILQGG